MPLMRASEGSSLLDEHITANARIQSQEAGYCSRHQKGSRWRRRKLIYIASPPFTLEKMGVGDPGNLARNRQQNPKPKEPTSPKEAQWVQAGEIILKQNRS